MSTPAQQAAALALASALLCVGCVKTRVEAGGVMLESSRFLWPGKIAKAQVMSTNGISLLLEGYQSDTAQLAGEVAKGVATGIGKGVSPLP